MGSKSKIQWTGLTHQFVSGCSDESPGCANCYAKRQAHRMGSNPNEKVQARYHGLTVLRGNGPQWSGEVRPLPDQLAAPARMRAPRTFFINSLSDTFHRDVPDAFVMAIFGAMAAAHQHRFQVLTKRAERLPEALELITRAGEGRYLAPALAEHAASLARSAGEGAGADVLCRAANTMPWEYRIAWPLRNAHLGVSVENKKHGVPRIAHLRATPAALRFLSVEPLLEDVGDLDLTGIGWVIVGGESGPGARRCDIAWVQRVVAQCREQQVPVFVKQLGARPCGEWPSHPVPQAHWHPARHGEWVLGDAKGGDPNEWPEQLRVREMPEVPRV